MIEQSEFTVSQAAEYATHHAPNRYPVSVHGLRKACRFGKGPRRVFDPARKAWMYPKAALDEWIAERLAQRTTVSVCQPTWLQAPEVRAKAAQAAAERRRAIRGERLTPAA